MPSLTLDGFSCEDLTAAVNKIPPMPTLLGQFFETQSASTTTVAVDVENSHLKLIPDTRRGTAGTIPVQDTRSVKHIPTLHLQQIDSITPEDVQNVRAFGSTEPETVAARITRKQLAMRRNIEATLEYHRLGAIKGKILDADGSTELLDIFNTFGVSAPSDITITFPTSIAAKSNPVLSGIMKAADVVDTAMGGSPYTGIHAICGATFWDMLIGNPYTTEAYINFTARQDALGGNNFLAGFTYGGVTFHRYSQAIAGQTTVAATECHVFPVGPGVFSTVYAPADYMETVNTDGMPFYSKIEERPFGKGYDLEVQSNPICICTFPESLVKLVAA